MGDQPPPPPPHGTNPRRTSPNLPPGKYDIFIIPPHSSGAGFLYLPSLKPSINSFAAGFASALVLVVLFQSLAPAFRVWYKDFQGMGNMGILLLVIAVGIGAWALGRIQNEGGSSSGNRGDSRHSWSYSPGDNGPSGGPYSGTGPPPHSRAPDPDGPPPPPPPHGTPPPPRSGPSPNGAGAEKPKSSWQERPQDTPREPPHERPQEHPKERPQERPHERPQERPQERPRERARGRPQEQSQEQSQDRPREPSQAESTKGSSEKAREETRRKEEERKAKEVEQRKKEEISRRIRELREKEARDRAKREQEAKQKREKEAREKEEREREIREKVEREARIREEHEREIRERLEKEARIREKREREVRERLEKESREARERLEKEARAVRERLEREVREAKEKKEREAREAKEREEREAREKEQQEKEQRERQQQEKTRREKELRDKRLQEARERELRDRLEREKALREKLEREAKEREAREREAKEREVREREAKEREAARLKEAEAAKAAEEAKKAKEAETTRRGTYAFSSVGEKTNPWPNGKPPVQAFTPAKPTTAPSVAPSAVSGAASSAAPSASPSATQSTSSSGTRRPPPPTAQSARGTDDDAYSYRPYDQPKAHTRRRSGETIFTESSYAPSQSTSRTTPPPSVRGPYTTKDPDKIVIKAVYGFLNQFSKTPASQLVSGVGHVTDGLILRITTEGLFIDDDVRGVPQREWDVKAWTLRLMEVWCPAHTITDTNASPRLANKPAPRFKFSARGQSKALMGDEADAYLTELLHACKDDCRMGPHGGSDTASSRGSQAGEWKHRGLHVLRATIRDQEGKRYLFVLGEEEGWKVAVGLQRLRKGTQVRQLGIQPMPQNEARTAVETLGW